MSTLKAMKQFDRREDHRSAAKEVKKTKAVLDDSSSDDSDYVYAGKKDKVGAMMTPVKGGNVFGKLLTNMKNDAQKSAIRGFVSHIGDDEPAEPAKAVYKRLT